MRVTMLALLVLVVDCASPSPLKKPSPYRYTTNAPSLALGTR